jgi:hypothetical protein
MKMPPDISVGSDFWEVVGTTEVTENQRSISLTSR